MNIGGVANVTYVGGDDVLAFDTGPGNAPIDDWAQQHTGTPVDEVGRAGAQGPESTTHALDDMLAHPFFDARAAQIARPDGFRYRARGGAVGRGRRGDADRLHGGVDRPRARAFPGAGRRTWVVCGGGRHNQVLMENLRARVNAPVLAAEDVGWRGDFLEAEAFAYLAERARRGLPLSLPTTTAVPKPMTGGRLHKAK